MYFDKEKCRSGINEATRSWDRSVSTHESSDTSNMLFLLYFSLENSLPKKDSGKIEMVLKRLFDKAIEHGFEQGFDSGFTKGFYSPDRKKSEDKQ